MKVQVKIFVSKGLIELLLAHALGKSLSSDFP